MHRISDVIGKTVVSAETGDRLGSVSDTLIDEASVVGLVVGGGLLAKERVLPFRDVQTLGGDTVLARTGTGIVGPKEWRTTGPETSRSSALRGRAVVTTGGTRLGEVSDVLIDERTGAFEAFEVSSGGLRSKRSKFRASSQIRIGADAVVVPEEAIERAEERDAPPAE